jgi:hypothetical protein
MGMCDFIRLEQEVGLEALKIDGAWFDTMIESKVFEEGNGVKKHNICVRGFGRRKEMCMGGARLRDDVSFIVLNVTIVAVFIEVIMKGDIRAFHAVKEVIVISVVIVVKDRGVPWGRASHDFLR